MDRLRAMESFAAVAKHGNYSKAAKEFGVSRSLLSKRIIELEAHLGVRLFSRNTHRLGLTDTGMEYLNHCQAILSEIESVEMSVTEQRSVPRGSIRILTSKTFGIMHMGRAISDFSILYPGIQISLTIRDMAHQSLDLVSEGFDLAVRTMDLSDSSLIMKRIARVSLIPVAAPTYLHHHKLPKTPQDLAHHNCLYPGGGSDYRWMYQGVAGIEFVKVSGSPRSNITIVLRDAAIAGLGVGLLPEYCVGPSLAQGRLIRLLASYQFEDRSLFIVYQKNRYLPMRVRLFIDFLTERFKDTNWDLTRPLKIGPLEARKF